MPRTSPGDPLPGILSVVHHIREHRGAVARTLRERFAVGLSDLGDAVTWGEAKTLLEEAAGDPSTALGAVLADWAYPASIPELISITAQVADPKASKKLMPWVLENHRSRQPEASAEELAEARGELEADITFTS